jgi:hypothetical protein
MLRPKSGEAMPHPCKCREKISQEVADARVEAYKADYLAEK